jgi:hypothetical protein
MAGAATATATADAGTCLAQGYDSYSPTLIREESARAIFELVKGLLQVDTECDQSTAPLAGVLTNSTAGDLPYVCNSTGVQPVAVLRYSLLGTAINHGARKQSCPVDALTAANAVCTASRLLHGLQLSLSGLSS